MDASTGSSRVQCVDEPLTATRWTTASRLPASEQRIPQRYTSALLQFHALEAWPAVLNETARPVTPPLIISDYRVWASAATLYSTQYIQ